MADRCPSFAGAEPRTRTLTAPPSLTPLLARGAVLSPFKRPRPDAPVPATRLVLSGVRVDLAHLAAYERVCGFATGADVLPVTYPHVLAFPLAMRIMAARAFPLPLLGLVHTSIEITQHQEPAATAEYELAVLVEGLAPHRRGTEATVLTEARSHGRLVWESRSTYLARHRSREKTPRNASPKEPTSLPAVAEWHLAQDVGRRYGAVSGDRNPIHLHPLTARLFGFPRAIAHGMWTVARCLAEYGPQEAVGVRAEFRAPVPLPGTVTYAVRGPSFELRAGELVHLTGDVRPIHPRSE
ncbi:MULTISPECIES: MaoC/PaaZ C-terminal domain-containing protein [unclassified Streptomyces]|uniref:MaoC family dehydratase n=1 Tax=unclassified Streptomyces TaxID=2593676 RepID=UPI00224E134B|nr:MULTISPECIES: MaoC/PaaZ C-terminal domain-containing protein [unclassified Streptomyces]MCX4989257.1 MaoC/PaaZ C-terminal domain-containing protein [Streptomyces sp. NBC_00568]MCX5005522.1 MaoC/PaaZ C-terminal domain-containing protein [Streptomyces sp. NBC_00638]